MNITMHYALAGRIDGFFSVQYAFSMPYESIYSCLSIFAHKIVAFMSTLCNLSMAKHVIKACTQTATVSTPHNTRPLPLKPAAHTPSSPPSQTAQT